MRKPDDANWWRPKKGFGEWTVQLNHLRTDFGLCINKVTGERKQWSELKPELYGPRWDEVLQEVTQYGQNKS